jgi:hypothetical protein
MGAAGASMAMTSWLIVSFGEHQYFMGRIAHRPIPHSRAHHSCLGWSMWIEPPRRWTSPAVGCPATMRPLLRSRYSVMVSSRGAEASYALPLARFEREVALLILLTAATPTGGIPAEFARPCGSRRTWARG